MCQHEGLAAEANTLAQLATIAQNDVRACLNTLQFVRAKSAVLTDEMVSSGSIGRSPSPSPSPITLALALALALALTLTLKP